MSEAEDIWDKSDAKKIWQKEVEAYNAVIKAERLVRELHYAEGVRDEQDRIIDLLEARSKCGAEHDYNGSCYCEEIALIKGETNV